HIRNQPARHSFFYDGFNSLQPFVLGDVVFGVQEIGFPMHKILRLTVWPHAQRVASTELLDSHKDRAWARDVHIPNQMTDRERIYVWKSLQPQCQHPGGRREYQFAISEPEEQWLLAQRVPCQVYFPRPMIK